MSTRAHFHPTTSSHPALAEPLNARIVESEILGGVRLDQLLAGAELELETENRSYCLLYCGNGHAWIKGHPIFCPQPVLVRLHGSTWGGAMLKTAFIGRGMHLEFLDPQRRTITTSRILEIREIPAQGKHQRWPNVAIF